MTIDENYIELAQRYDKLKQHSVRQRRELRRMNRTINRIGEVRRDAIWPKGFWGLKSDNRELRETNEACKFGLWILGVVIFIMVIV